MSERRGYQWDNNVKRYRDPGGRFISQTQIRNLLNIAIDTKGVVGLTLDYKAGLISQNTWHQAFRVAVKNAHLQAGMLAKGGRQNMTAADWGKIGGHLAEQYYHLDVKANSFLFSIDGLTPEQAADRAKMYIEASRQVFEEFIKEEKVEIGAIFEKWMLGTKEHCPDCLELAGLGWVPIGTLWTTPGAGDTQCLTHCGCHISYRNQADRTLSAKEIIEFYLAEGTPFSVVHSSVGDIVAPGKLTMEVDSHLVRKLGGPGSGHYGHKGRPGQRGGSASSGGGPQTLQGILSGNPTVRELEEFTIIPTEDKDHYYYTHALKWKVDMDPILEEGISPDQAGNIYTSKGFVRDRSAGYVIIKAPKDDPSVTESVDVVSQTLKYPQFVFNRKIEPSELFRAVRAIPLGDKGHSINEDQLVKYALTHQGDPEAADLPPIYQKLFALPEVSLAESTYSRSKCMLCDKPPTVDILWAEGMGRAWFCDQHYQEWTKAHPGEEVSRHVVKDGEVPEKWGGKLIDDDEGYYLEEYSGSMVALFPPADLAKKLAIEGGLPPEDLHVTLATMGEAKGDPKDFVKIITDYAKSTPPLSGQLNGIGRFSLEDKDAYILTVDLPLVAAAREKLVQLLPNIDYKHGFTPHMTLAYIPHDTELPESRFEPVPVTFDTVTLAWGSERFEFPLEGSVKLAELLEVDGPIVYFGGLNLEED